MCYLWKGWRPTYRVKESERAGGVKLQSVRVADFAGVFGLGIVALEGDGLLWRGRGRRVLVGSLLLGSGCHFGFNLRLLP
jgi:hypothetical protein